MSQHTSSAHAAATSEQGEYYDGQPLICGCSGNVSVDGEETWINTGNEECPETASCYDSVGTTRRTK